MKPIKQRKIPKLNKKLDGNTQFKRIIKFDRWYEKYITPDEHNLDSPHMDSKEIIKKWREFLKSDESRLMDKNIPW